MKIMVIGLGYVGLSLTCLFAKKGNKVLGIDVDDKKISSIKKGISPIKDDDISNFLKNDKSNIEVSESIPENSNFEFTIICTPTNYDELNNKFDTASVESTIDEILKKNVNYNCD